MKKLIVIAGVALLAVSAYSQGTVAAANGATSLLTNSRTSAALIAGTTFKVGLYYLVDQATAPTSQDFTDRGILLGATVGISPVAGRYSTGTRSTPATTAPGGDAWFQVRAWEAAFGSTWNEAAANPLAIVGTSQIVKITTGNPTTTPPGNPTSIAVPGFILNPVPEPSVIALGLLGVGGLLLLRRRK